MKKIFTLILLAGIFFSGKSQSISLGLGKSWICGGESWKDPLGVQVSLQTSIFDLNEKSLISGGIGISLQGARYEESYVSGSVRLGYLIMPFLYKRLIKDKFYGEIGLQPGFLLMAKDKYEGASYDYKSFISKFELGLPFGAGYKMNEKINLGIRATYGLTNLDNSGHGKDHNFLVVALISYYLDFLSD